jgi:hypothetical protein
MLARHAAKKPINNRHSTPKLQAKAARALPQRMDEHRHRHTREEERRNGEQFRERARLTPDELRSGKDEASCHLRHEHAEQAEEGAAVDVAGNEGQHDGDRPGNRNRSDWLHVAHVNAAREALSLPKSQATTSTTPIIPVSS